MTTYGSIDRTDEEEAHLLHSIESKDQEEQSNSCFTAGYGALLLVAIIVVISFPVWDKNFYNALHQGAAASTDFAVHENSEVPFPRVDRSEFGVSASEIVDPNLFSPLLRGDGEESPSLLKVPFPTGAFWTNFIIEPTADRLFSYPVMAYPYGYKWNPDTLQVSLPSLRPLMDSISIRDVFMADLTLTTAEDISTRYVQYFDPLSVTLRYEASSSDDSFWETYIVQGSPYVTAKYENMTPVIHALSTFKGISCLKTPNGHCTNPNHEHADPKYKRLHGTQFSVQTKENLTWLLFTSEPVTIVFEKLIRTTVTFEEAFSGIVRLALIPPPQKELTKITTQFPQEYETVFYSKESFSPGVEKLIDHANVYPVGADVAWDFPSTESGRLQFQYKTRVMDESKANKDGDLLMLALPHHTSALPSHSAIIQKAKDFDLDYQTIKGPMTAVIGSIWILNESLTSVGFDDDIAHDQVSKLSKKTKITILDQVALDVKVILPTLDENIYGYGKQVARLAQLIHIANVLLHDDDGLNGKYASVTEAAQDKLHGFLTAFLTGETVDSLVYDVNFGGLVTQDGLEDFMNDFGNGWYNDHHFHYGYYLYACSLLGKWNSTFVSEYGHIVDSVMFDVTHSSYGSSDDADGNHGAFFPLARHKSWFDGHSFASGLFPFASGKSMESSSESINCYYGAYLWSTVRNPNNEAYSDQLNFARLLLAMEIRGVKTYWHMKTTDDRLYNPVFSKNLMVGNLGMMDATVSTWFGKNPLYVHMINFMPVTAITRELFDRSYLEKEYTNVIKPIYNGVEMAWKGYVVCDRAMLEPNKAWDDALQLRSYELDQALSQSQVLYFISTSDGFKDRAGNDTEKENVQEEGTNESSTESDFSKLDTTNGEDTSIFCMDHPACVDAQLTGVCCPSQGGMYLGCCKSSMQSSGSTETTSGEKEGTEEGQAIPKEDNQNQGESGSLCSENKKCADLELSGFCCPAPGGDSLSCCD